MTKIDLKKNPAGMHLWVDREMSRHATILKEAITAVFEDTPVVPGIAKGGSRIRGTIPYDRKALAKSLRSRTRRRTIYGKDSWRAIVKGIKNGDTVDFTWGNTGKYPVDYAQWVHSGANGIPGTYWATIMAQKLPWLIDEAAKRHPSK